MSKPPLRGIGFMARQNGIDVVRSVERLRVAWRCSLWFGRVRRRLPGDARVFRRKSREVDGRGVRENGSAVAVFDEAREQTGVIQVSVS